MGKQELLQILESQKKEIKYLNQKVETLKREKDDMVDNFKLSTGVLLERLKDLEAQTSFGERPQTANILSKISTEANGKRIGGNVIGGSKNKKKSERKEKESDEEQFDVPSECPNCKQLIEPEEVATHTVQCYRQSTKCKICGEVIQKDSKKEHLNKWRDQSRLKQMVCEDNEEQTNLFFDHGIDVNLFFANDTDGWTPMHYAAKSGSLNIVLALVSRGAGVDPPDNHCKTPLMVAIENNKAAVARSLIELGADIEQKDNAGRTPIMIACKLGSKDLAELLIGYKADIKVQTPLGDTCVSMAQKSGNSDVMMLLVKSGASIRPASRQRGATNQIYNENERMPILLPDCGHSFCFSCINDCFEIMKSENDKNEDDDLLADDDDLLNSDNEEEQSEHKQKKEQLFECPEDQVLCSIQIPEQLPKNFALLKIVQKTLESEEYNSKNIVSAVFDNKDQKFVVQQRVDKSLAGFLRSNTLPVKELNKLSKHSSDTAEYLQQVTQSDSVEEKCFEHDRELELICVDDKRRICSQCALFGKHKGHDVRMEEDVAKEINLKVEVLIEMYQAMEQSNEGLHDKSNYEKAYNNFKRKQNETKEIIQEKFKEWRQALRAVEMQALENLHIQYSQFEDRFQSAQKHNSKMVQQAEVWMGRAKNQIDQYTLKTAENPHFIDFTMLENAKDIHREDDILNLGEAILEKTEKQKGYPSLNGLENSYSQIKVNFDPNLEKKLAPICKVVGTSQTNDSNGGDYTTASASFLPPFNVEEVETFDGKIGGNGEDGSGNPLSLSNISFNESPSPINQTVNEDLIEERKDSLLQQQETSMIKKNVSQLRRGSTLIQPGSLKVKKNDLATMFRINAFDGELDLSGKNFSDMHSNEIAKCIKMNSGHVKVLNLSKNRLADDGLVLIVKALCESSIENVNLSGNKITEKNIDTIVGTLKTNKTLKVLDLSNNGIGSRVVKNKLKNALPSIEVLV